MLPTGTWVSYLGTGRENSWREDNITALCFCGRNKITTLGCTGPAAVLYCLSITLNLTQSLILPRWQEIKSQFSFVIPLHPAVSKVPWLEILHNQTCTQTSLLRATWLLHTTGLGVAFP